MKMNNVVLKSTINEMFENGFKKVWLDMCY